MAIKTTLCYAVACDACGATPETDPFDEAHFPTIEAALHNATNGDWWATEGLVLCWCDYPDDDHVDRAREYAATLDADDLAAFLKWCPTDWHDLVTPEVPRFDAHMPGQTTIALTPARA